MMGQTQRTNFVIVWTQRQCVALPLEPFSEFYFDTREELFSERKHVQVLKPCKGSAFYLKSPVVYILNMRAARYKVSKSDQWNNVQNQGYGFASRAQKIQLWFVKEKLVLQNLSVWLTGHLVANTQFCETAKTNVQGFLQKWIKLESATNLQQSSSLAAKRKNWQTLWHK